MKAKLGIKIIKDILILISLPLIINCSGVEKDDYKNRVVVGLPIPEGLMDTLLKKFNVPGASISVIHDGEIDWMKGYGLREYGKSSRVDSTTLFQAASISKPVSAVVALLLTETGAITLDENVNNKLKSWKVPENQFTKIRPVTLRQLLSHSAGLPMHGVPEFASNEKIPSLIQILDGHWYGATEKIQPLFEPGSKFQYSGGGYIVLQVLISDITGKPFEAVAKDLLLKPAGMLSSTFEQPLPKQLWPNAAVGHLEDNTPIRGRWHTLPEQAAGGLWTTPRDLSLFMIKLWRSYQGLSDSLLCRNLANEMLSRQIDDFGLGISLPSAGVFRIQHAGGNSGYRCFMVLSVDHPEGVVIMTNSNAGEKLIWKIFELIAHAYGWSV
jgi:CubicO group peptidase (beta-lactamase class C family)